MSDDFLRKRRTALDLSDDETQRLASNDLFIDFNCYLEGGDVKIMIFTVP